MAGSDLQETASNVTEPESRADYPKVGRIPVRNLWLLMLYASNLYRELPQSQRVSAEDNPDEIPDLAAEILARAVELRLRRNLSFAFQPTSGDLRRVRGSIDLLRTERRQLLRRARVACRFEVLTVDTPRNRFVRAALQRLTRVVRRPELVSRCTAADARLERAGVSADLVLDHPRGRSAVAAELRGRLDPEDRRMLAAAELSFSLALPTESAGRKSLASPDRDEIWARRLFEAAVGGFYDVVLSAEGWTTRTGSQHTWPVEHGTSGLRDLLPSMETDIVLDRRDAEHPNRARRIIIDTKFTSMLTPGRFRKETLRSGYIYQIYSYLRSQEDNGDSLSRGAMGMLLHPAVEGDEVFESGVIQGHEVRFATVNLAASSRAIRERLLSVVSEEGAGSH